MQFGLPSSRPSAEMPPTFRLGLVLGAIATLLWCAFLTFLGKSIYVFFATGEWPALTLSSSFDVEAPARLGDAWLGWYFLGGSIAAMLITIGCAAANRRKSSQ
jgi:hypothetical protein